MLDAPEPGDEKGKYVGDEYVCQLFAGETIVPVGIKTPNEVHAVAVAVSLALANFPKVFAYRLINVTHKKVILDVQLAKLMNQVEPEIGKATGVHAPTILQVSKDTDLKAVIKGAEEQRRKLKEGKA